MGYAIHAPARAIGHRRRTGADREDWPRCVANWRAATAIRDTEAYPHISLANVTREEEAV
jgi:hypothetical protein